MSATTMIPIYQYARVPGAKLILFLILPFFLFLTSHVLS